LLILALHLIGGYRYFGKPLGSKKAHVD
jgi:hypothetical protein